MESSSEAFLERQQGRKEGKKEQEREGERKRKERREKGMEKNYYWMATLFGGFPSGSVVKNLPAMQETQEMWV